jgi:hypothetical protein
MIKLKEIRLNFNLNLQDQVKKLLVWNFKLLLWVKCHLGANMSTLPKFHQNHEFPRRNFIKLYQIQTLEVSWILVQNPLLIWGSFYKESCFPYRILQNHILLQIFWARERSFWIEWSVNGFEIIWNHLNLVWIRLTPPPNTVSCCTEPAEETMLAAPSCEPRCGDYVPCACAVRRHRGSTMGHFGRWARPAVMGLGPESAHNYAGVFQFPKSFCD